MQFIAWTRDSEGIAKVEKATPQIDGAKTRQWRLTFTQTIESREQTAQLPMFPAAEQAYQDASDEQWSTITKATPLKGTRVELDLSFQTGDPHATPPTDRAFQLVNVSAEVKALKLKTQPAAKVVEATVWLHGVPLSHADAMVHAMGRHVQVTVRALAPEAFIVGSGTSDLEDGQLVAGRANGTPVCGRLLRLDKQGHPVIDDFGAIYTLDLDPIPLGLTLASDDDLDVEDHVRAYEKEVRGLGGVPAWQDVLEAATLQWAADLIRRPSGGTLYLDAATFGSAVRRGSESPTTRTAQG